VRPAPITASPAPAAAYAAPWRGTVPWTPFSAIHDPGSSRFHRMVPGDLHRAGLQEPGPRAAECTGISAAAASTMPMIPRRAQTDDLRVMITPPGASVAWFPLSITAIVSLHLSPAGHYRLGSVGTAGNPELEGVSHARAAAVAV
jgi:hypothetical protein